jgi:hypothetical protein
MKFADLDSITRKYMLEEIERDECNRQLYFSSRLSEQGVADYPNLLKAAAAKADESFLAAELKAHGRLKSFEPRNTKNGVASVKVPITAAETLAESEFNRFYARALCRRAIDEGKPTLEVYRAKHVNNPRTVSEAMIGTLVSAQDLLVDLRTNPGTDTALGLPPGPNSGLSVRLPQ